MTHRIEPGQTYHSCKPGYEDFRIRITSVGAEMARAVSIDGGWALLNPVPLSRLYESATTRDGKPRRTGYALEFTQLKREEDAMKEEAQSEPLMLEREQAVQLYDVLRDVLGLTSKADTRTPPPPGSTREQLPDHILALIVPRPYLSTACETAEAIESATIRHPEHSTELGLWQDHMHERCRSNNKHTGLLCRCDCHGR